MLQSRGLPDHSPILSQVNPDLVELFRQDPGRGHDSLLCQFRVFLCLASAK